MQKQRVLYYDILNICACLAVIFLHCNGLAHTYSNTLAWKQAMLVETFCYWAVPIFFMLSGATLMNYREKYDTKTFFVKRAKRTFIPFVVWSILNVFIKGMDFSQWGPRTWLNNIFLNRIENIYWFFLPLFAVYLSMPVLSHLTEKKHRSTLWYMVAISFAIYSVAPVFFSKLGLNFYTSFSFPVGTGYILFVVLGYLLSTEKTQKKYKYCIYVLGLAGAAFRYFMTWHLSAEAGSIDKSYFGYTQFHSVLLAVAVFELFKNINWEKLFSSHTTISAISQISSCSFGIYLIHMTVYRFLTNDIGVNSYCWEWRIFAPFMIYLLSLTIIFLLKKIPVVRTIIS